MKRHQYKLSVRGLASLSLAPVALLLSLSTPALAQRGAPAGSSPNMDRTRESGVIEHQQQLQVLLNSKEPGHTSEQRRLQAIIEQTKQDFDRIQVLNRELVEMTSALGQGLNYRSLTDTASEIRKRARRLKDNISLPPPEGATPPEKREGEISREELKDALLMLSQRITSFATNPLFQTTNVIDARLGAKASRDLEIIIGLSTSIRKSAEKLGKSAP
jgi:hypothetical protein